MKQTLIKALDNAFEVMNSVPPQTKTKTLSVSIDGVPPHKIKKFMAENNIPKTAYFGAQENDDEENICLYWDIIQPLNGIEQRKHDIKKFQSLAWYTVYKYLTNEGYTRVGLNSGLLKEFDDTTVFDMYVAKDFDRLVKYYSLYFKQPEQK